MEHQPSSPDPNAPPASPLPGQPYYPPPGQAPPPGGQPYYPPPGQAPPPGGQPYYPPPGQVPPPGGQPYYPPPGPQPGGAVVLPMPGQPMMVNAPPLQVGDLLDGLRAYPGLLVKQKPKGWLCEAMFGCEIENEYGIYNPHQGGGKILVAKEKSSCLCRQCCGILREFEMGINTMDGREIVHFKRPFHYRQGGPCCCCLDFCFQVIQVHAGAHAANPGKKIGYIREDYSFCVPVFSVFDDHDVVQYKIVGNCCGFCNYTLNIFKPGNDKDPIGVIQKRWAGAMKELFTDADNFFITFPADASAEQRALLLGALFLLDMLFFENNNQGALAYA